MNIRFPLYRALCAAGWCGMIWLALLAWQQSLARAIVTDINTPAFVGGFTVSAEGFEQLRGELLETARIRAEQKDGAH